MASCHWHLGIMSYRFFHVIYKTTVSFTVIVVTPFFHDHVRLSPRTKEIWNIISEVIIWKHTILLSQHPNTLLASGKLRFSLGLSLLSVYWWSVVCNQPLRKSLQKTVYASNQNTFRNITFYYKMPESRQNFLSMDFYQTFYNHELYFWDLADFLYRLYVLYWLNGCWQATAANWCQKSSDFKTRNFVIWRWHDDELLK